MSESRGQLNVMRVTPHAPLRGSFAATELLTNPTFESGTTGWADPTPANSSIAVQDRVLRVTRKVGGSVNPQIDPSSLPTVVQYAPYCMRGFFGRYRGAPQLTAYFHDGTALVTGVPSAVAGMATATQVARSTTLSQLAWYDASTSGGVADDYFDIHFTSFARCALVDNGPNMLLQSEAFGTSWSVARGSVSSNAVASPDGATTADNFVEDGTAGVHTLSQSVSVSSSALDYVFSVAVKANTRTFVMLQMVEATSSTTLQQYFNLTTGAVGSTGATGANWAGRRAFTVALGNGWTRCYLVGRKTNAATSISCDIFGASADGTVSYTGGSAVAFALWGASAAQSSVPVKYTSTTTTSAAATAQTGGALTVKGLSASTSGLLENGDWFEVIGQLKQCTSRLNSNAAGLGEIPFRPALADSPADNDPVIVNQPFGRFIYPGGREMENLFGVYADCEMNLEEIYV